LEVLKRITNDADRYYVRYYMQFEAEGLRALGFHIHDKGELQYDHSAKDVRFFEMRVDLPSVYA
jgi:hypothetical protein